MSGQTQTPAAGAALLGLLSSRAVAPPEPADWAGIAEVASWHGLLPALQIAVGDAGLLDVVPAEVRDRIRLAHVLASMRAAARRQQLGELLGALSSAGVPAIVLKGAYLAEHAYASPEMRPMSDIDLLLPVDRPEEWGAALRKLSYVAEHEALSTSHRHTAPLNRGRGLSVEPHHTIDPCAAPYELALAGVWERAVSCEVAGAPALALAPEDLLVHLATHMGASHVLGASLVSVCDVARWTERFGADADWDAIVTRARSARVRRFVYAALALAHAAIGAAVPAEVLCALRGPSDDVAVAVARRLLGSPPFLIIGAKAVTDPRDSGLSRIRRVARALLLSPARISLRQRLPDAVGRTPAVTTDGYRTRWGSLTRLATRPTLGLEAIRHVIGVRSVRRWAADATQE